MIIMLMIRYQLSGVGVAKAASSLVSNAVPLLLLVMITMITTMIMMMTGTEKYDDYGERKKNVLRLESGSERKIFSLQL